MTNFLFHFPFSLNWHALFFPSLPLSSFFLLSVSFVASLSRPFITRQKLVIQLELRILRAATCLSYTMTIRMALKVRTVVHNDLLLLMTIIYICCYSGEPSIYLHIPLGCQNFFYVTISLLQLDAHACKY